MYALHPNHIIHRRQVISGTNISYIHNISFVCDLVSQKGARIWSDFRPSVCNSGVANASRLEPAVVQDMELHGT